MSLVQVSIGFLVSLPLHEYVYLFKIERITAFLPFKSMGDDKRSKCETSCFINYHTSHGCSPIHHQQGSDKESFQSVSVHQHVCLSLWNNSKTIRSGHELIPMN